MSVRMPGLALRTVKTRGFGVSTSERTLNLHAHVGPPGQSALSNLSSVQSPSAMYIHMELDGYVQLTVVSSVPVEVVLMTAYS